MCAGCAARAGRRGAVGRRFAGCAMAGGKGHFEVWDFEGIRASGGVLWSGPPVPRAVVGDARVSSGGSSALGPAARRLRAAEPATGRLRAAEPATGHLNRPLHRAAEGLDLSPRTSDTTLVPRPLPRGRSACRSGRACRPTALTLPP